MSVIGRFEPTSDGYSGTIKTLTLDIDARLVSREKGPDFLILGADDRELGAAWRKAGEHGNFLSVKLDCPALLAPINAIMSLKPNDDGLLLMRWQRRGNGRDEP